MDSTRSHKITIEAEVRVPNQKEKFTLIRRAVRSALEAEKVLVSCEVNILVTDDAGIHEINLEQRQVDGPTDVLSFPMLELSPGVSLDDESWAEPDSGRTVLGDMVLSYDRIRTQAKEFGHSEKRELCYLVVHSVLHLLGYDHLDEGAEKARMREREEAIMDKLDLPRT